MWTLPEESTHLKSFIVPLQPLPAITKVRYRVGIDLIGPLVESKGYEHILTFLDHFTKCIETRPLKTKEAKEVAKGIFSINCRQGASVQIVTDNVYEFTRKLKKPDHCKLIFTTPYHSQTNELTESANRR